MSEPKTKHVRFTGNCAHCGEGVAMKRVLRVSDGSTRAVFCVRCKHNNDRKNSQVRALRNKKALVDLFGGECSDCGYSGHLGSLCFYLPGSPRLIYDGGWEKLVRDAEGRKLLCFNCFRLHQFFVQGKGLSCGKWDSKVVYMRRWSEVVEQMGGLCEGCWNTYPPVVYDAHHVDPDSKNDEVGDLLYGDEEDFLRAKEEAKLCALLCVNCHREVHAGVRTLKQSLARAA